MLAGVSRASGVWAETGRAQRWPLIVMGLQGTYTHCHVSFVKEKKCVVLGAFSPTHASVLSLSRHDHLARTEL